VRKTVFALISIAMKTTAESARIPVLKAKNVLEVCVRLGIIIKILRSSVTNINYLYLEQLSALLFSTRPVNGISRQWM